MFDLRDLGSCTVFYNDARLRPIDHVAWNPVAPNLISVVPHKSYEVITIDIRNYRHPVGVKLHNHKASINGIAWAPHNADHFCTVGSDHLAQLFKYEKNERVLEYRAEGEINTVKWSKVNPEFMAITYQRSIEVLRV
uniref:WD_REPEATS_REGION domain-containing protein n=1 Tax=Panagrellus redivivus TaxID=6233 RepID=A0A7E4UY48_PANRE